MKNKIKIAYLLTPIGQRLHLPTIGVAVMARGVIPTPLRMLLLTQVVRLREVGF